MAAVDKIYGNALQRECFLQWCKEHLPEAVEHFYPERDAGDNDETRAIALFPECIDRLLWRKCSLQFVRGTLRYQYDPEVLAEWSYEEKYETSRTVIL